MPFSLFWIAAAVALFWAVGAYNRLVRLRAQANAAFAALESELKRQVELVHACLPAADAAAGFVEGDGSSLWGGLQGAATQFSASLAAARSQPLEPQGIAALAAARQVLAMAWARAEREDTHDLAGARLPESVSASRAQLAAQAVSAAEQFNAAVALYNQAIGQFPALLLAWLFGFKPGGHV